MAAAGTIELPGEPTSGEVKPFERWDEHHLELLRTVWGGDFVTPGDKSKILQLVKPFGLNPAMSLLELGAGMGGASRAMAKAFGVWVTGMEAEGRLVEEGMALSEKAGLEKKSPIIQYDPHEFQLKARSYDCIFSKESFFTNKDKTRLIQTVELGMKDNGQLLFTDFMIAPGGSQKAEYKEWAEGEPVSPDPWSLEEYVEQLTSCKLDVRIKEDITESYCSQIVRAWADYLSDKKNSTVDPLVANALVEEVELWTRRVQAFESGALTVCRIYAQKKTGGSLLSDW